MVVKDYYKILNVPPGAATPEIKKKFRKLALQFHPDTNQGKNGDDTWFREVQEAYDTLTDPAKKAQYLQLRWLCKAQGKCLITPQIHSLETLEAELKVLAAQVADMDYFRMDHSQLAGNLMVFLTEERWQVLQQKEDPIKKHHIGVLLLKSAEPLPYSLLKNFYAKMQELAAQTPLLHIPLQQHIKRHAWQQTWQRHQWWVMLLTTLLLCGIIAMSA